MTHKVLVAFAMKEEFAPWRRRHRFRPLSTSMHPVWVTTCGVTEVYVALTGAGAPETDHFRNLTAEITPSIGIVTGVAAGLKPEWRSGDLLAAETVTGPGGELNLSSAANLVDLAVRCGAKPARRLLTLPRIARTVAEKMRLAGVGDVADMESLPLMKQWAASGVPALALRVVLDAFDTPMTCDFEAAMDPHGQIQIATIVAQLARHPQLLPDFLGLARQSRRVLKALAAFMDRFFDLLDCQSPTLIMR